jgi:hypothetical protein
MDLLTTLAERAMPQRHRFTAGEHYFHFAGGHGTREKQLT